MVKIYSGGRHLDAAGKVVYSAPNLGIGVSFHYVGVHSLIVLKEWLLLAAQAKYHPSGCRRISILPLAHRVNSCHHATLVIFDHTTTNWLAFGCGKGESRTP